MQSDDTNVVNWLIGKQSDSIGEMKKVRSKGVEDSGGLDGRRKADAEPQGVRSEGLRRTRDW